MLGLPFISEISSSPILINHGAENELQNSKKENNRRVYF